jgi:hypothetical protein
VTDWPAVKPCVAEVVIVTVLPEAVAELMVFDDAPTVALMAALAAVV